MKKLFEIVFLCLFLNGCATYSAKIYSGGDGKIVKADDEKILLGWEGQIWSDDEGNSGYNGSRRYSVLNDLNKERASRHCASKDKFAYFFDDYTAKDHLNRNDAAIFICSAQDLVTSPISGKDRSWGNFSKDSPIYKKGILINAKKMCKEMGFKSGSDKFSGCVMEVALAELSTNQNSSSIGGVVTINDPARDSDLLIKRGQGLINGTCTLGNLSNC